MNIRFLFLCLAVCCCLEVGVAQTASVGLAQSTPAVVPITKEPSHHLVLENEYVRVFKVEVAPHSETQFHQHDLDYVFVTLGDSDVESVRVGEKPLRLQLKDGETRFTKGGFAHKAENLSDKPFVNVTVELKKGPGQNPEKLFDRCTLTVCERQVVVQSSSRCTDYSSVSLKGSTGVNLPKGRNRLLVASTKTRLDKSDSSSEFLDAGEIKWTRDSLLPSTAQPPGNFFVCEFAEPGEDFLKSTSAQPGAAVPHTK